MINKEEQIFLDSFFERNQLNSEYTDFRSENSASSEELLNSIIETYYFDKQIDFPDFFKIILKENEKEFLDFLIDNHELGLNSEIHDKLINNNIPTFVEALNERKILSAAIKKIERENLKARFTLLDKNEVDFLDDREIKTAIKRIERENLKEEFKKIDQAGKLSSREGITNSKFNLSTFLKIAAIVVVISLPLFILFTSNKEKNLAKNEKDIKKTKENIIDYVKVFEEADSDSITKPVKVIFNIDIEFSENHECEVNEKQGFGFAQKLNYAYIKTSILNQKYAKELFLNINDTILYLKKTNQSDTSISTLKHQLTILKSKIIKHKNNYLFNEEKMKVEIFFNELLPRNENKQYKFSIYKLDKDAKINYFLEVNKRFYYLEAKDKLSPLILVKDSDLVDELLQLIE